MISKLFPSYDNYNCDRNSVITMMLVDGDYVEHHVVPESLLYWAEGVDRNVQELRSNDELLADTVEFFIPITIAEILTEFQTFSDVTNLELSFSALKPNFLLTILRQILKYCKPFSSLEEVSTFNEKYGYKLAKEIAFHKKEP